MTTYTLEIDGDEQTFESIKFSKSNESDPDVWEAILSVETGGTIAPEDSVVIARNGTTIFQGIVEYRTPKVEENGKQTIIVGGRQTKVKIWRKWNERYASDDGFFTSMYPGNIIEFLLRPSFSDPPERGDTYKRIGTGIDPLTMTASTNVAYETNRGPEKVLNRLDIIGFESSGNQTTGDYVSIDLGSTKDIVGIVITNRTQDNPTQFARNYAIDVGNDAGWVVYSTKATQSDNRAINIIESWTPGTAYQYIRIRITDNAAVNWSISDIYVYESSGAITGISVGTISSHPPFNGSLLTQNASDGQPYVYCKEYWRFAEGDDVLIIDDSGEETGEVASVDAGNERIELTSNLTNAYTTADSAIVINLYASTEINIEYGRRTEAIDEIVGYCMTNNKKWQWECTDAGAVNVGLRTGSDKSGSISFVRGTNLLDASTTRDDRKRVDKILVLGGGTGDEQDINSSGWIGDGEYETVIIDKTIETAEAAKAKAYQLLEEYDTGYSEDQIVVYDTYETGTWGIDDDVTVTDSYTGMSGSYRVKKINRNYSSESEATFVETTNTKRDIGDVISALIKNLEQIRQKNEKYKARYITDDPRFIYKIEAEELILDSDVTIVTDLVNASEGRYILMASTNSGDVILGGPSFELEAGLYRAIFVSQVNDNSSGSDLVTFKVYSADGGGILESLTVQPNLYFTNNSWCVISFSFQIDEKLSDINIIIDGFVDSIASLSVDFIGIQSNDIPDFPPGPPTAPTGVNATAKPLAIEVNWDDNTEQDLAYYIVYRNTSPNAAVDYAHVYSSYFVDKGVSYGTTYYYRIKAVDWSGNISDYSDEDSAAPAQVTNTWLAEIDSDWLAIELRPWTHNLEVEWYKDEADGYIDPDFDRVYWGKGGTYNEIDDNPGGSGFSTAADLKFANGSTDNIEAGSEDGLADGIHFLYWDDAQRDGVTGYLEIQVAHGVANYGDAVGSGKGLIAIVQIDSAGGEPPSCIPVDSYTPHLGAGVLNAVSILSKHITATEWIEGKHIRTSGVTGEAGGAAGVMFDDNGIIGYSGGTTKTFALETGNGYIYVYGDGNFIVAKADETNVGYLDGTIMDIGLGAGNQDAIILKSAAANQLCVLQANGRTFVLDGNNNRIVVDSDWDKIIPDVDAGVLLGDGTRNFRIVLPVYTEDPASPVDGEIWIINPT